MYLHISGIRLLPRYVDKIVCDRFIGQYVIDQTQPNIKPVKLNNASFIEITVTVISL